mmetsp:Transcript_21750/g.53602  ORF Transcript_21750/g.53602 Transcript_21750/m.53602 type:complete len:86 (-) Transcript_21750:87-344(-)|eukprot:CAMPEP_0206251696 /NCGR_PEP_ID=MMETSP0047_2-20121206/22167_1 /ASSEMBLY_ACC=CAM_ASM_000192 /TAXON_ID=195065 /ORGANISM="Chroomonas mesostigmatica_cf, Strain CCMP1168" /LENGTH=85 /DNA_ID=CAMNT_0053677677 /DNA_START=69 /DNA_END=326 /DNA_ORIENTATION=-
MASGFGAKGNVGRCYPFWLEFTACLHDAKRPEHCACQKEDYVECLHHKKEFERMNTIMKEAVRQQKEKDIEAGKPLPWSFLFYRG